MNHDVFFTVYILYKIWSSPDYYLYGNIIYIIVLKTRVVFSVIMFVSKNNLYCYNFHKYVILSRYSSL